LLDYYNFWTSKKGRNTVQFTYLMAYWRHNSVTVHVTKFYFIQLVIKIKYIEFEDNPKNCKEKPVGMWKEFPTKN